MRCLLCSHKECSHGFPTDVPCPQPVVQGCWHCFLVVTETVLEIILLAGPDLSTHQPKLGARTQALVALGMRAGGMLHLPDQIC